MMSQVFSTEFQNKFIQLSTWCDVNDVDYVYISSKLLLQCKSEFHIKTWQNQTCDIEVTANYLKQAAPFMNISHVIFKREEKNCVNCCLRWKQTYESDNFQELKIIFCCTLKLFVCSFFSVSSEHNYLFFVRYNFKVR